MTTVLGPNEGLGVDVVAVEIVVDRVLQLRHAPEDATPDAFGRDLGEEALDHIEPGGARRGEVPVGAAAHDPKHTVRYTRVASRRFEGLWKR